MLAEDTLPARPGYPCELLVRVFQRIERLLGGICDQNFLTGTQKSIESWPRITQQRRAACGRFEQAAGGAIPHRGHLAPGHVERQSRGTEEPGMAVGGHVTDEPQVVCPGKVVGITGATQHKTLVRAKAGGLDEQSLQLRLAVMCIGAEIGQVRSALRIGGHRMVGQWINVSVQGRDSPGTQQRLQTLQCSAAGVAEHQVEVAQPAGGHIFHVLPGIHARQSNRCIQIVEYVERARRCIKAQRGGDVGVGAVGCDDGCVRAGDMAQGHGSDRSPVAVKHELRTRKAREITMGSVVRDVFLEEDDLMPARAQGVDEPAPQSRMAVAPGGAECKTENDYLHIRLMSKRRSRGRSFDVGTVYWICPFASYVHR